MQPMDLHLAWFVIVIHLLFQSLHSTHFRGPLQFLAGIITAALRFQLPQISFSDQGSHRTVPALIPDRWNDFNHADQIVSKSQNSGGSGLGVYLPTLEQ
jgi:hypothetical protein